MRPRSRLDCANCVIAISAIWTKSLRRKALLTRDSPNVTSARIFVLASLIASNKVFSSFARYAQNTQFCRGTHRCCAWFSRHARGALARDAAAHRHLWLDLSAMARRLLSEDPRGAGRAALCEPPAQHDRDWWLVLLAADALQLRAVVRGNAGKLHLQRKGRAFHHAHEKAARYRDATGELLRLRLAGIARKARAHPVAISAELRLERGTFSQLLQFAPAKYGRSRGVNELAR